jgi:hypothetical protein
MCPFAHPLQDTPILLPLHHLAINDERWVGQAGEQDPTRFHPARMMSEEGKQPGAQMPFGSGPRWVGVYGSSSVCATKAA